MATVTFASLGRITERTLKKELEKAERQFRVATGIALTKTAKIAQRNIINEMRRVFDRPTRWTLGATYVQPATKRNKNQAKVALKDASFRNWPAGQTPPVNHLYAQVEGGQRQRKRHELALQRIGVLPPGYYITPGKAADIDQYGNMRPRQIVQILSYFQAFGETGYKANSTIETRRRLRRGTRRRAGISYFVAYPNRQRTRHLQPGIYQKRYSALGTAIRPVMIFVKRANYKKRLRFYEIAERTYFEEFDNQFEQAFDFIRNTPRRR